MEDHLITALRTLAADLEGLDREVYETLGKDPLEPVIGLGRADCPIGFFGRDPGKDEIRHAMPFVGAAGQQVRRVLYRRRYATELPYFAASLKIGEDYFWANTLPYKPLGNKAWSMAAKRRFQPLIAQLLLTHWSGRELITLGREAFLWFGINQPKATRQALEDFWQREDRFRSGCEVRLSLAHGQGRSLRLHPLPHPSPLNATWYKRFPGLLDERLTQLEAPPAVAPSNIPLSDRGG